MTARAALGLAWLAVTLSGGCSAEVPFELRFNVPLAAPDGGVAAILPVDLSSQVELWSQRERVRWIQPESLRLEVVDVRHRTQAESTALALSVRPEAASATGAREVALPAQTLPLFIGAVTEADSPAELGGFLLEILRGSGRFSLVAATCSSSPVYATVELVLAGTASVEL